MASSSHARGSNITSDRKTARWKGCEKQTTSFAAASHLLLTITQGFLGHDISYPLFRISSLNN